MEQQYAKELELALKAAHRASIITKNVMLGIDSFDKTDASPVTAADFAAQALIICAINHLFPDDDFIAEESADMLRQNPSILDRVWALVSTASDIEPSLPLPSSKEDMMRYIDLGSSSTGPKPGRIWILDPVDGTATFMRSQQYAVCLCLTVNGEQKVAVLGCPNLRPDEARVEEDITDKKSYGVIVYAVAGQGAFAATQTEKAVGEGKQVRRPTNRTQFADLQIIDSIKSSHADIPVHQKIYRSLGVQKEPIDIWSQQMKYIALAFGASDAMIRMPPNLSYRACVWDHAGGQLIYQESGGVLTDMHGQKFEFGQSRQFVKNCGYIAGDKEIHASLSIAVQKALAERTGSSDLSHTADTS